MRREASAPPRRSLALAAWRKELAEGKRTTLDFDWLWRAACAETTALEFEADGLPSIAAHYRERAVRIVREAARQSEVASR